MFLKHTSKIASAFTLIETLAALFIFSVVAVTFYTVFSVGLRHIAESKNRLGAVAVANEKMEIIRNLKYADVGVENGIPAGGILQDEDIVENAKSYHVKTFVQYIDDAFDGTLAAGTDIIPNDYKRVKVTVSWGSDSNQKVTMTSRFVPPGLEVNAGDGILAINVLNSMGVGIAQSTVHVVNNAISPAVDITTQTDNSGSIMFPGAKASKKYEIAVSKSGYETVATVDPSSVSYVPVDSNASVLLGSVTSKSIVQDRVSDFSVKSIDQAGGAIPNVNFHLKGGRILGASGSDTIYQTNSDTHTNGSGELNLTSISPGQYVVSAIAAVSGYTLVGIDGITSYAASPVGYGINVSPGSNQSVNMKFANNSADSLLVKVVNKADGSILSNAKVTVTNTSGYNKSQDTLSDGVVLFPGNADSFIAGEYTVKVESPGFQTETSSVTVSQFTKKQIELTEL